VQYCCNTREVPSWDNFMVTIHYCRTCSVQCALLLHYVRTILSDANYSLLQQWIIIDHNVRPNCNSLTTQFFSSGLNSSHDPASRGLGARVPNTWHLQLYGLYKAADWDKRLCGVNYLFALLGRPTLVGKALSFTQWTFFTFLYFYQCTALSSRTVDSHQMYFGGSVVGKA